MYKHSDKVIQFRPTSHLSQTDVYFHRITLQLITIRRCFVSG